MADIYQALVKTKGNEAELNFVAHKNKDSEMNFAKYKDSFDQLNMTNMEMDFANYENFIDMKMWKLWIIHV